MALTPGTRLGSYEILDAIGAGGMGEVYRARDDRLGRDVAIKVLPSAFADDADRLRRFEREARALASLNHPNLGAIYGLEETNSTRALILELVQGVTLADRLRGGAIPATEAVAIARQIADGLEAAHERGIIHRDLKPANIKLTPDGVVKVLDFGLAKALDPLDEGEPSERSTITMAGTAVGAILGTAAYMSPEQARGLPVDRRTDVWAFGCVLYEMLTGRRAFPGGRLSDTIAAVLSQDPDWTALPDSTPPGLRRVLVRCLAKDPKRRTRDLGDVRLELDEMMETATVTKPASAPGATGRWRVLIAAGLAAALGVPLLIGALGRTDERGPAGPVVRATLMLPADQQLDTTEMAMPLALSPDGERLVYVARKGGQSQLYLRRLDAFDAVPIAGTEGARYPFFSPDGESVAFFSQGKLKRVSMGGGSPSVVCDTPVVGRGGTWSPDGTIVFDPGNAGLMRVPAGGGTPQPLQTRDPSRDSGDLNWPHFLPDGRVLLATVNAGFNSLIVALSLNSGEWHELGQGVQAQYVPPGYLAYHAPAVREGEIHVVPFDAVRVAVDGTPTSVLDGVFRSNNGGGSYFAVSRAGSMVFARGSYARALVRVERNGRRTPLTSDRRGFRGPDLSPDGRRVAVTVDPRPSQVWVYDVARGLGIPLSAGGHNLGPGWTADGRQVIYTSGGDLFVRAADASNEARRLLARDGAQYAGPWLDDGRSLIFTDDRSPESRGDIQLMSADSDIRPLVATRAHESMPALSPDGRWLAYVSNETGRFEVYVQPFPNLADGKWLISTAGGFSPIWSPSGNGLFWLSGTTVMAAAVRAEGAKFEVASPERLFDGPFDTGSPQFDLSPDGSYFVMIEADPDARPTQIHAVVNWTSELGPPRRGN
jgi:Tol biopolymer transport system component